MRKIKVLALVLVFTFAALGGAYAMWYDSLFLDTTVETGSVDVSWVCVTSSDPGPNYKGECGQGTDVKNGSRDSMESDNPNGAEQKNIGSLNAELDNTGITIEKDKNEKLVITLENGYPGYQESVEAGITNNGTVPVKFRIITTGDIPTWLQVKTYLPDEGKEGDKFNVLEGYQLDPGATVLVTIVYLVTEDAPENTKGVSFKVELKGVQWNGYSADDSNPILNTIQKQRIEDY